jgi:hypothetical protein
VLKADLNGHRSSLKACEEIRLALADTVAALREDLAAQKEKR